ncbi:hypothetical protein ACQUWN_09750 [Rossellomorea aquimaris]|uniref:hypothetical protein n=1 Tax=Bacillaceae TaxID=186817 RepID=UPI0013B05DFF|nr:MULTISPECIES: hypothetical protein [Bacillaceae]
MEQETLKPKVIMTCSVIIIISSGTAYFCDDTAYAGYSFMIAFLTSVVLSIALIVEE